MTWTQTMVRTRIRKWNRMVTIKRTRKGRRSKEKENQNYREKEK